MDPSHMSPEQRAETAFCVFENATWGFRAMSTIFLTYHAKDGVNTIRQGIHRWAPPVENNTDAYVKAVADACGIDPDAPFPYQLPGAQQHLLQAVSIHECGGWFFSLADLVAGVGAATVH